ncbi:MAG: hypothetical protein V3575_00090 [Candidatus Absconditabacteria bacterium]
MSEYIIDLKKGLFLGISFSIIAFVLISIGKAFETELNIDNNSGFLQSLFFTIDGKVNSNKNISLDGKDGTVSLSGSLNILPGAIADKKLVSSDFSPLSITNNDIGSGQVVDSHFVSGTISTNKIINNSLLSGSFENGSINNTKILNNTGYIFNKIISNTNTYFLDPAGLSSFYVLSGNHLKVNNLILNELIIGDISSTSNKLSIKGDLLGNNICDADYCVGNKPNKIGDVGLNKRCQYKGGKIECLESFGD